MGRWADRFLGTALRLTRSQREVKVQDALVALQASCGEVVRARWMRLTLGMTLYTALLFTLMCACLAVTGSGLAPAAILGGFAVERLLTLAGITPGGAGIVEIGLTGILIALGGAPAGVVAGVLLYRALTFGLEIPVGGIGLAAWLWLRRRGRGGVMRVVHVSDCYWPRLGGIELHLHDLVEHQRKAGDDARVVTTTPATNAPTTLGCIGSRAVWVEPTSSSDGSWRSWHRTWSTCTSRSCRPSRRWPPVGPRRWGSRPS